MKKFICLFLALAMCFALLAGCDRLIDMDPPPESEPEESTTESTAPSTTEKAPVADPMSELQEQLFEEGCLCAVAYLGVCEGNFIDIQDYLQNSGLTEALPLLQELTSESFIEAEGMELYLVVPRQDVGITVYEQVLDEETYELTWGSSLYVGFEAEPLLLRGNISDIVPNLGLFIEGQGGETMEYSPCLSLENGLLAQNPMICDISPYETIPGGFDGPAVGDADSCIGSWYAEVPGAEGETLLLELILNYEGVASYGYGPVGEEFYEYFQGTWWHDDEGTLCLSLHGGNLYDAELQYDFYGEFLWDYAFHSLSLAHTDGDSLIRGLEGSELCFTSSSRYALVGLWTACQVDFATESYLYQDLELLSDGTCFFLTHDGQGTTYSAYEGTWSESGGEIDLYMEMYSGSDYQEETSQALAGCYHAVIDADGWLLLRLLDGDALTQYMYDCGEYYFMPVIF